MEEQELHSKSLEYLVLYPDGYDSGHRYPLVILLHGFGANMYDLASLAPVSSSAAYFSSKPPSLIVFIYLFKLFKIIPKTENSSIIQYLIYLFHLFDISNFALKYIKEPSDINSFLRSI